MKKRIKIRGKVTEILAVLLSLVTFWCSVDTTYAAGNNDGTGAEASANVTFQMEGEGALTLINSCNGEKHIVTDSCTLSLPIGTYVHMTATSLENSQQENIRGIGVEIQTEQGYQAEDQVYDENEIHEQDITVTPYDKVVSVRFQTDEKMPVSTFASMARGTEERPETGDMYSGTCNVSYVDQAYVGGSVASVQVNGLSGILSDVQTLTDLTCQQHSAAAPVVGMAYDYTYTVTSVNQSSGEVNGVFYAKSQVQPSDGVTMNNGKLAGYQAIGGSAKIIRKYTGYAKLVKRSEMESLTANNPCYSLAGAIYGIYSDANCSNEVGNFTTDKSGNTNTVELPAATYYVKEKAAPKGFCLDPKVYSLQVTVDQTATLTLSDNPGYTNAELEIDKLDQQSANVPQGKATLEGAKFVVRFYEGYYNEQTLPEKAAKEWVLETKKQESENSKNGKYICALSEEYKVDGDEFYTVDGQNILPLGTMTVEEKKAPKGYLLQEGIYLSKVQMNGENVFLQYGNQYEVTNRVIRGDLEFTKADEHTQKRMSDIPFRITSVTTGETHIMKTDENGYFSSASDYIKHSENTNSNDGLSDDKQVGGIWFGLDKNKEQVEVNDLYGAFPYDTYFIEELSCEGNEGKELYQGEVTISREHFLLDMGTIDNYEEEQPLKQEVTNEEKKVEKKTEQIKTGDYVSLTVWILLLLGTLTGAILTFLYKRKRR